MRVVRFVQIEIDPHIFNSAIDTFFNVKGDSINR
jgi:hypothetical protein